MLSLKREISRQPLIYVAVICAGYAVDLTVYLTLISVGAHLYAAYLLSFVVGAAFNVILLRRYFAAGRYHLWKDVTLTLASNGILILIAFGIYVVLMTRLAIPHLAAKLISNAFSVTLNYVTRRRYF